MGVRQHAFVTMAFQFGDQGFLARNANGSFGNVALRHLQRRFGHTLFGGLLLAAARRDFLTACGFGLGFGLGGVLSARHIASSRRATISESVSSFIGTVRSVPEDEDTQSVNVVVGTGTFQAIGATARLTVYKSLGEVDPNHSYFQLIGRIMAEWAYLEHSLDVIIWSLGKFKSPGMVDATIACITAQVMGPTAKCDTIIALIRRHGLSRELEARTRTIQGNCGNSQSERNRMAHDSWFMEPETQEVGRFRKMAKKELEFGITPEDNTKMNDLITTIQKRRGEVLQLHQDVWKQLETLSGKA